MDDRLRGRLEKLEEQIDTLKAVEHRFLELDASKKMLAAQLYLKTDGKNVAEREAQVFSSADWKVFITAHVEAESEFNFERRRYELRMKAFDAEYLTLKTDHSAIRRQTG